ncbi:putative small VCP/p97-interacting protein [Dioscorea sansibarensis]
MALCSCFGPSKAERKEAERIESQEARGKAAEAAQKRQEQFEKSAVGRAARKQVVAASKQSNANNPGEPVLKWQVG